ncbi:major facilitator superfamily domain-containing protein [Lineolata rhizophorae]|uniref:Major facilitator superfamily domain-containing protein n=1 Tax=Lineolata rhizophorae TaxID=578093 RepID=A0A6A6NSY9_9PEZI|nr:major facilitator superfamily domain-containing protein [Lineolata rhizophorae]
MRQAGARLRSAVKWLHHELGLSALIHAGRDTHLLLLTRFLRMLAYSGVTLILALHLRGLGNPEYRVGLFMTLTLLGDVLLSLLLTLVADGLLGRRRTLLAGSLLLAASGVVFAACDNFWVLLAAATLGVISPSGSEIGPFRAVEESVIAHLTAPRDRPAVFAWYVVTASLGSALGLVMCGAVLDALKGVWGDELEGSEEKRFRAVFWGYAGAGIIKAGLTLLLSERCELDDCHERKEEEEDGGVATIAPEREFLEEDAERGPLLRNNDDRDRTGNGDPTPDSNSTVLIKRKATSNKTLIARISPSSRLILFKLCLLFSIDSLSSGMVPYSWLNYYVSLTFSLPHGLLGALMAANMVATATMNLFSPALARRIGLIRAMVFTHLPAAVFLAMLGAARSSLAATAVLLMARASLNAMDQAPRSAFVAAVVKAEERTAVMGIVNVVRTLSQSGGPTITGVLAGEGRWWVTFVVAGSLKVVYDVGLLANFANTKLHESSSDGGGENEGEDHTQNSEERQPENLRQ